MAIGDTYTTGLKSFIENNANAGYIRTSSEITTSDIAAAVSQIIGNEYVKSKQLAQVATSGNYNHLSNLPTLHRVASSGDYFDLINRPTFHEVATSGDYNKLINKPDIESRVDTEVNTLITNAINDLRTEIKGANVGSDYNTLAKLQSIKSEVKYMDVTSNQYNNLVNFGNQSFYTSNTVLVNSIITNFSENKIIILQSNYGNFVVTNLFNNQNYCQISATRLNSNYDSLITQFQIDNPGGTFEEYVMDNIELTQTGVYIMYDKTKPVVFYFKLDGIYITQNNITEIQSTLTEHTTIITALNTAIPNLTERIAALESYHSSSEPGEPEEP